MPASAELFTLLTPSAAWAKLAAHWRPVRRVEEIDSAAALGRVLAADVTSREDLPAFRRSTVDGYAVRAIDTHGASAGLPALLTVTGEAPMGQLVNMPLRSGEAVLVHTGSMLPADADAVVMVEHTQTVDGGQRAEDGSALSSAFDPPSSLFRRTSLEVMRPVASGENVLQIGEDARSGAVVYAVGHRIRPADIGGLMALGVTSVRVAARPRVGIISTGDEVIDPSRTPAPGQVRDVNAYALAAQAQAAGADGVRYGIVPDRREALEAAARRTHEECDLVVLSAGSSVSARDMSVEVIDTLGAPGVLVHGVSVKPGKPAIIAVCVGKPVFGLPGNPASAMLIFDLFVTPAIDALLGAQPRRAHTVRARLSRNVPSATGRADYVQVNLEQRGDELWATPIFGKSNLIYTLVRADGRVKIELDANGVRAGEWVDVQL
jgi:molybdopterin molybdotransferase